MDRNRILEKITKALNLANNASATPGEAAAALHSAQKMMAKYEIDEKELGLVGLGDECIRTTIQVSKVLPKHMTALTALIRAAFGVKTMWRGERRKTDLNWNIYYYGRQDKVAMAVYTHTILARAIERSWAETLEEYPGSKGERGARFSFWAGWIAAVSKQVHEFALTDKEKEALKTYAEDKWGELSVTPTSDIKLNGGAARAGHNAADGFRLHRPMNGTESLKLEN